MNKSSIFSKAHSLAKEIREHCNSYHAAFSLALIEIYASLKAPKPLAQPEFKFKFGTRNLTAIVTGSNPWEKGEYSRIYYEIDTDRVYVLKLYQIVAGPCRDKTFEINGIKFGYDYGCCNSHVKREIADGVARELAAQIVAQISA